VTKQYYLITITQGKALKSDFLLFCPCWTSPGKLENDHYSQKTDFSNIKNYYWSFVHHVGYHSTRLTKMRRMIP